MIKKPQANFFPFLYLLIFAVVLYSVNDMATSSNAYKAQGNRTMVYVALIAIIALLGLYFLYRLLCSGVKFIAPSTILFLITMWIAFDNLLLGNIIGSSNMWTSITHTGLSCWWMLTLFFGYYYPRNNVNKQKQLMCFVVTMLFYYCWQFISVLIESNATHDETTVLNLVYRVVVFVPAIYLLENKKLRNFLLLVIFAMTVASMKRGAIIILPIMMLVSLLIDNRENKDALKKIGKVAGAVTFGIFAFFIADSITDGFLSHRFSIEELMYGSSRSEKYAAAIAEINTRGFSKLMLGIGSAARSGIHNEVLEFLYTFGVVGLLLYIALIISMVVRFFKLYKSKSKYASMYAMIVVFFIVVGLYSGVYFTHSTFYLVLVMGIIESRVNEEQKDEKNWDHNVTGRQLRSYASGSSIK